MVSLAGLFAALYVKFRCTDDIPSLDEMITMFREAVDACLESNEYRSDLLGILCATRGVRDIRTTINSPTPTMRRKPLHYLALQLSFLNKFNSHVR